MSVSLEMHFRVLLLLQRPSLSKVTLPTSASVIVGLPTPNTRLRQKYHCSPPTCRHKSTSEGSRDSRAASWRSSRVRGGSVLARTCLVKYGTTFSINTTPSSCAAILPLPTSRWNLGNLASSPQFVRGVPSPRSRHSNLGVQPPMFFQSMPRTHASPGLPTAP